MTEKKVGISYTSDNFLCKRHDCGSLDPDGDGVITPEEYLNAKQIPNNLADEMIVSLMVMYSDPLMKNAIEFMDRVEQLDQSRAKLLYRSVCLWSYDSVAINYAQFRLQQLRLKKDLNVLPDDTGKIKSILVSVGGGTDSILEPFKYMANACPDIEFLVVVNKESEKKIVKFVKNNIIQNDRIKILTAEFVDGNSSPHPWPQDSMEVAYDKEGKRYILIPESGSSENGRDAGFYDLGRVVSQELGLEIEVMPRALDGGDVIVNSSMIFTGYYEMREGFTTENFLSTYYGKKKIVFVGDGENGQAELHIDMFIKPLSDIDPESGKKIVIVGDINLANQIISEVKRNNPDREINSTVEYDKILDHKYLFTQIHDRSKAKNWEIKKQKILDGHAKQLEQMGYHVVRIPYYNPQSEIYDDHGAPTPFLTYTNAFIENYVDESGKKVKRAIIPQYEVPELDDAAKAVYEKLGYEVIQVPGLLDRTFEQGSLRCSFKVLDRSFL